MKMNKSTVKQFGTNLYSSYKKMGDGQRMDKRREIRQKRKKFDNIRTKKNKRQKEKVGKADNWILKN